MEKIVRHQWNFLWVSKQLVKAFNFWLRKGLSYFFKLIRAIAGNHNFTPLDNQRNYFAKGTFCGFVFFNFFLKSGLRVASVQVQLCNHCHPWPSVITSRLVCWLLPALLFSQVLLTGTWYSIQIFQLALFLSLPPSCQNHSCRFSNLKNLFICE